MNDLIPRTLRCRVNETTIEVCHGEIPDIFRQSYYDPVTEFELPDAKETGTDEDFRDWLDSYRRANLSGVNAWYEVMLLHKSCCS